MNLNENKRSSEKSSIGSWPVILEVFLIRNLYQRFFSPFLGQSCRFQPTCSEYGIHALFRHGFFIGNLRIIWRIIRCNPFSKGGYDPA